MTKRVIGCARKLMTTSQNASEIPTSQEISHLDFDLLDAVGLGDERALATLYDRYSDQAYSVALRVCGQTALAEAILQNIFMRIWLAPQQFSSEIGSLEGKIGILSRNVAVDLMRRRKSSGKSSLNIPIDSISHTEVSELMKKPHALVLLLPDADRKMLEMAFFDGMSLVEICKETGLPAKKIAGRLRGALSVLRNGAVAAPSIPEDTGLEVLDLDTHPGFTARKMHTRDVTMQMEGLSRLTHSFVQSPNTILQELVNAAVELCGADSAGISLEIEQRSDEKYWHWAATAGQYNGFMNAVLPRYPSACGICLERGKPQLFRVGQQFFNILGIDAPLVTDGILLPWEVEGTRGTIFIMAHGRTEAFNKEDGQMMRVLADFAAMAFRYQQQQHVLLLQAKASAAAAMANNLAHQINNPLQSLMNLAYLAAEGKSHLDTRMLGQELSVELRQLSDLVTESLALTGKGSA